jgi:hypothetical protein
LKNHIQEIPIDNEIHEMYRRGPAPRVCSGPLPSHLTTVQFLHEIMQGISVLLLKQLLLLLFSGYTFNSYTLAIRSTEPR